MPALPYLYLAGQSGVGKSSLLNAAIAPALADSGWVVLTLRPHDDPFGAISAALLKPNAIWQKPPSDISDPRERVERAADRVRRQEKRLLLIIDQFEEALILCDEQAKANLSCFLLDFIQRPVDGLVVLLSLRAEYLNDIPDLGLPAASFGQNCFGVRPFTQAEAQAFIEASGLDPGAGLLDKVLQEAAEIEDMPDKVRPIVLNMFLVIAPFKGPLPKGIDLGRLLSGYVERCLNHRAVRGIAVEVLRPLVTDAGTKRTLPLGKIAEEARVQPMIARGCLILLANDGLVRALDKAGERWEVAHDFVARLLHPIIRNWRKSAWEAARPWLAPTALSLWLLFFVGLVIYYPSIHEDFVLRELRTVGLVPGYDDSVEGATFVQNGARINNRREFWRVTARLADLSYPVVGLTINNRDLTSLKGLPTLDLTSLNLNNSGVTSLQDMPALPTLTSLALVDTGTRSWSSGGTGTVDAQGHITWKRMSETGPAFLTSLQGMPELPALTSLDLSGSRLTSFQGMPALLKLTFLTDDTQSLTSLQGMPALPVLYRLNLENSGLTSLQGMPTLPRIEFLMLGRSRGLTSLQGMPLLPNLTVLWLNEDSGLMSLQGMPELPALTHLNVENSGLTSLQEEPGRHTGPSPT